METINTENINQNYENELERFFKKFGRLNPDDLSNVINKLIGIIKGTHFERDPITKKLQPWEQSFKSIVAPRTLREKSAVKGTKPLYFPCKPNNEEYIEFGNYGDSSEPLYINTQDMKRFQKASNYAVAENELNATYENGQKGFEDILNPFVLTQNLHTLNLSHSTLLDFIFANTHIPTDEKRLDSITSCFEAVLELCSERPNFVARHSDLWEQAMYNATPEVVSYATSVCPILTEYAPKTTETTEDRSK